MPMPERGDHRQAHRRVTRAHVLHQIVGAHDEQREPRMRAGDLLGAQDALGRLHHRPHRHRRRRAGGIEQRHDAGDIGGTLDLGHQDGVGARRGDRRDVGLAPGRGEPVAADRDLALAVGLALGRRHDVGRAPLPWRRAPRRPRGRRSAHRPAGSGPSRARACWRPAYRGRCGADGRSVTSERLPGKRGGL